MLTRTPSAMTANPAKEGEEADFGGSRGLGGVQPPPRMGRNPVWRVRREAAAAVTPHGRPVLATPDLGPAGRLPGLVGPVALGPLGGRGAGRVPATPIGALPAATLMHCVIYRPGLRRLHSRRFNGHYRVRGGAGCLRSAGIVFARGLFDEFSRIII